MKLIYFVWTETAFLHNINFTKCDVIDGRPLLVEKQVVVLVLVRPLARAGRLSIGIPPVEKLRIRQRIGSNRDDEGQKGHQEKEKMNLHFMKQRLNWKPVWFFTKNLYYDLPQFIAKSSLNGPHSCYLFVSILTFV